jgi:hypothetical protein
VAARRRAAAGACAAVVALALPAAASAHGGRGRPAASAYRARVTAIAPAVPGLTARVLDGDLRLRLRVSGGVVATVLGDLGEPMLRIARGRVDVNVRSPTAQAARIAAGGALDLDPRAAPQWRRVGDGPAYTWHEHRLAPRAGQRLPFAVPLRVDGRAVSVRGARVRGARPPLLETAGVVATLVAVGLADGLLRRGRLAVPLALGALAAMLVALAGAILADPSSALATVGVPAAAVVVAVAVALGLALVPSRYLLLAAAATGGSALLLAAGQAAVLVRAYPVSALPDWLARTATAAAIGAGLGAIAAALAQRPWRLLEEPSPR